ncbi:MULTISPECIES: hypothetical protein [Vibrio harveyi group]|uniref:hypothetical protein n=1 Tax=Vibrio harveyi group TaxID=717610 RepID=UPI0004280845|nr:MULTISPECIES: hypothetical protein [Vibrio harveyi group]KZC47890.1 hypothetical protein XM68_c10753 [Vibrio alginolyticus]
MINEKRNHHFISQVEQVFHARSVEVKAKKINRFQVIDKQRIKLRRTSKKGTTIANNLSFEDLYCFDFLSRDEQYNFEDTFGRYESDYKNLIEKIIYLDEDPNNSYLDLFTYKWMNIIRNPFCIKNTLSIFGQMLRFIPTDSELLDIYKRIEHGNKPHEKRVCEYFGVTEIEYTNWLKLLFLVLFVNNDGSNLLESFTRAMFYEKESSLNIFLFSLSEELTVFSDVGFTLINQDAHLSYEFPLTDSHYIAYAFTNIDTFTKKLEKEKGVSLAHIHDLIQSKPKEVRVKKVFDDLATLKSFNVRMVEQSWQHVFSKATKPFVL